MVLHRGQAQQEWGCWVGQGCSVSTASIAFPAGIAFPALACGASSAGTASSGPAYRAPAAASCPVCMGIAQVVGRIPLRRTAKLSAVSPEGQPLVQLMLPAATELATKTRSRMEVGASVLCQTKSCSPWQGRWQPRRGAGWKWVRLCCVKPKAAVHGKGAFMSSRPASVTWQTCCARRKLPTLCMYI